MKSKDMPNWKTKTDFLVDIKCHLSILDTQLQGCGHLVNVIYVQQH